MTQPESIRFFDTGTKDIVALPTADRVVSMYTCGPTVYKDAHIGNMRAYMTSDIIRRAINLSGGTLKHVINITDVGHLTSDGDNGDDKVAKSATERGLTAWNIAKEFEGNFWEDYDALGIQRPEIVAHATEHIPEQISLIEDLERAGITYRTDDGIYFDSTKFPEYAKFANLDLDGIAAGTRVDMAGKHHVTDFALWKFPQGTGKRDMEWDSPWGTGFPGWHIECSAMAMKYLGPKFDIHTGGIDHIPIHHTNEIAQAKAAGNEFADYWVHTAFLLDEAGEKMSKSSGVSSRLPVVIRDYGISVGALRYLYLTHHYQSPLGFGLEKVSQASAAHTRLLDSAAIIRSNANSSVPSAIDDRGTTEAEKLWTDFTYAMTQDNFNSPAAIDTLHRTLKSKSVAPIAKDALIEQMDSALSLGIAKSIGTVAVEGDIGELLGVRAAARTNKDYTASDTIRDTLLANYGIRVIDSPAGQVIRKV